MHTKTCTPESTTRCARHARHAWCAADITEDCRADETYCRPVRLLAPMADLRRANAPLSKALRCHRTNEDADALRGWRVGSRTLRLSFEEVVPVVRTPAA